jgi:chromosome partitioning protein
MNVTENLMSDSPKIIVLGNEKGGTGKSTTAMHLIVALLRQGKRVGSMDLDTRQSSLTRYIENRKSFKEASNLKIPVPEHVCLFLSKEADLNKAQAEEEQAFNAAFDKLAENSDYIVIDCPGSDRFLSQLAHRHADILITPMNDSFIDLDVLAHVDGDTLEVKKPSCYSEMVWQQRQRRALEKKPPVEWIVMRNRLSNLDARNKRHMNQVLEKLSKRLSFKLAAGFGERVIFREMFLQGLTLLDFSESGKKLNMTMSHIAARQEVKRLLEEIQIS